MGGSASSQQAVTNINQAMTNVIMNAMSQCSGNVTATQSNVIGGLSIGSSNTQSVTVSISCAQNFQVTNDIVNQLTAAATQAAANSNVSTVAGSSSSGATTNLQNLISTNITSSAIQQSVANIVAIQLNTIEGTGVSIGSSNIQDVSAVQTAVQNFIAGTGVANTLVNGANQSANNSNNTSWISQLFSGIYGYIALCILIIVVIVIGVVAYKMYTKKQEDAESEPEEPAVVPMAENGQTVTQGEPTVVSVTPDSSDVVDDTPKPVPDLPAKSITRDDLNLALRGLPDVTKLADVPVSSKLADVPVSSKLESQIISQIASQIANKVPGNLGRLYQ